MKQPIGPATVVAFTLVLGGCGTDRPTEDLGSSASTVALLTAQERAGATAAVAALVRGHDSGRFTATATKAKLRTYLDVYASDVQLGTAAPVGPDEVVLVVAVEGPADTSSFHRPSGATDPAASGAIVVLDASGAPVSRTILLNGRRPDVARLGGPVELLDLRQD